MGPSKNTNAKTLPADNGSPMKKAARKAIGKVLPFSPRVRVTKINKVFVLGTQFGIILI
jgi:hypothetical protein